MLTVDKSAQKTSSLRIGDPASALVVGGGVAGMQAALDIANQGFKVYLVEKTSSIGGKMAMLDKTFPTLDCSACILTPKLSEVAHHPNIELMTYSEVEEIKGKAGDFKVKILKKARYVDPDKCSGCGDCVPVCPVEVPNAFDQDLGFRKAIYVPFPQATPNTHTVDKRGHPACRIGCPAHVNGQGFLALIRQHKYEDALEIVRRSIPFPGTLGRVCPAPCEEQCERGHIDSPINIRDSHRWLADHEREQGTYTPTLIKPDKKQKVAVVGAGPAGIACAERLVKLGYKVTVFEARDKPGGLLRYGIPEYRLPRDILDEEISMVEDLGVTFKYNKKIKSVETLLNKGFSAVFLGTGAPISSKLRIDGEDADGVYHALDFLDKVNSGESVEIGHYVGVIGGGNAAIDAARVAKRLGAHKVFIIYRRSRKEMPAIKSEIKDAEEEGIELILLASPVEILTMKKRVAGIKCIRMKLGEPDESGRRRPIPIPDSEFTIQLDNVIIAIGQRVGEKGPHTDVKVTSWGTPVVDPITYQTSNPRVFAGGDVITGGGLVVDAVAHGHEAAESIHRFLQGEDLFVGRTDQFKEIPSEQIPKERYPKYERVPVKKLKPTMRVESFKEIEQGYTEEQVLEEAGRCIECGICSECEQCVKACTRDAIDHSMKDEIVELNVGAIVVATGYRLFDVSRYERLGFGKYPNVIHGLQFERLINASGPTHGHLVRLSDGKIPKSLAFVQCVGSRDVKMGVPYCSRICCMYAIKNAVMAKEHHPDIDVTIYYTDVRAFGKGFEEFYQMAKERFGVHFIRGRVGQIDDVPNTHDLIVHFEDIVNDRVEEARHDMVVLSAGIIPAEGLAPFVKGLDLKMFEDGYIKVTDQFIKPVDSSVEGVFVCGCSDSPKDIPDSVTAGSAAAMHATIVLSKERD